MRCENCGLEVDYCFNYCPGCGWRAFEKDDSKGKNVKCVENNDSDSRMQKDENTQGIQSITYQDSNEIDDECNIRICFDCGAEFDEKYDVCPRCGCDRFIEEQENSCDESEDVSDADNGVENVSSSSDNKEPESTSVGVIGVIGVVVAFVAFIMTVDIVTSMLSSGVEYFPARCALKFIYIDEPDEAVTKIKICSVAGLLLGAIQIFMVKLKNGNARRIARWAILISLLSGAMIFAMEMMGQSCSREEITQYQLYRSEQAIEQWFE